MSEMVGETVGEMVGERDGKSSAFLLVLSWFVA